jgi:hypothetical protein
MSNEGEKKNLNLRPLLFNSKKNQKNKIKAHPLPLNNSKKN